MSNYMEIYQCIDCKDLQFERRNNICAQCGMRTKGKIARWITEDNRWSDEQDRIVGYWEISGEEDG